MSAVDDLVERVERAGAAERTALASRWKDRRDVEKDLLGVRRELDQQRDLERRSNHPVPGGWADLREASSLGMWILLTVFAVALAQQPKIRRVLMREIADYSSNAEAKAYAAESRLNETAVVRP